MLCSINLLFISCFLTTMIKTTTYFCVLAVAISMHLQILQMLQGPLPWKHLFRAELHHQEKQERGLVQLWQPEYHINEVIKADYYHLNFLQNIHSNRCLCNVWVYMMAKGIQSKSTRCTWQKFLELDEKENLQVGNLKSQQTFLRLLKCTRNMSWSLKAHVPLPRL